jgi:predicted transcriptional regulator
MNTPNGTNDPQPPISEWSLDDEDPFSDEQPLESRKNTREKRKKDPYFCKVPYEMGMRLARKNRDPLLAVLLDIIHRAWKEESDTVILPNTNLGWIDRRIKREILNQLRAAGLISYKTRKGKSPVVTVKNALLP